MSLKALLIFRSLVFFAENVFCTKKVKQSMQYFNVQRVKGENKVELRLYLSLTPSSVCNCVANLNQILSHPFILSLPEVGMTYLHDS